MKQNGHYIPDTKTRKIKLKIHLLTYNNVHLELIFLYFMFCKLHGYNTTIRRTNHIIPFTMRLRLIIIIVHCICISCIALKYMEYQKVQSIVCSYVSTSHQTNKQKLNFYLYTKKIPSSIVCIYVRYHHPPM